MKHVNDLRPFDDDDFTPPPSRHVGPQGDALILELQRLQRAFEDENDLDSARQGRRSPGRARTSQKGAKKSKKGRMGRAFDGWLKQFGFRSAPAPQQQRRQQRPRAPEARVAPPARAPYEPPSQPSRQQRQRPVAPRAPEIMDLKPVDLSRPVPPRSEAPRSEAPRSEAPRSEAPRSEAPRVEMPRAETARTQAPRPAVPEPLARPPAPQIRPPIAQPQSAAPAPAPQIQLPAVTQPRTRARWLAATAGTALTTGLTLIASQGTAVHLDDASDEALIPRVGRMYENELRTGLRILLLAVVLGGGWLTLVPLAGAVVVPGNLVVQSDVKAIQHPTGGIIAEIKVDNGAHVAAGDLLVRLDATQAKAAMQAIGKQLNEQRAKIARLSAERDGLDQPDYPSELTSHMDDDNVRAVVASENSLFKARLNTRQSQKDLLQGRVSQFNDEIGGMEAQSDSKTKQIDLINGELAGVQDLYDKHLVPLTRLATLQREAARIDGERGQLVSSIAETKSKIGEAQLQIVKTDQDFRTDVVKDLGEAQAKEGELVEKFVAARDQLNRIEVRAPNSGTIHQLAVHTIGGVIKAGETIMEVVPDSDELQVEAHVQPKDIDHVHMGQAAFVRFSAFNQRTTPQLGGQVSFVSPDTTTDPKSNATFYTVRIVLSEDERHRLGSSQLIPGMQAEVFVQTGKRTMLSYLMKPLTEQLRRAFVEE